MLCAALLFNRLFVSHLVSVFVVRWLGGSFAFLVWFCAAVKKQMCHQML